MKIKVTKGKKNLSDEQLASIAHKAAGIVLGKKQVSVRRVSQ